MSLTYREIVEVVDDLTERLEGGQIQKVYSSRDYPDREWVFQIRTTGESHYLLFSIDRDYGRLHLCAGKPQQPETPSPFTMLMRKWVAGSRLSKIEVAEDDRVVTMALEGGEGDSNLHLELTGRGANFVLESQDVLGAAHFDDRVKVGKPYEAPKPPDSLDPTVDEDRFDSDDRHQDIADWARERIRDRDLTETTRRVRGALKTAAKRLRRLQKNIESDLERAEEARDYRKWGELLQSAYGKVDIGAESVRVTDYYDEDLPEIEIPLEPDRSLQDNIDRYFHEYKRLDDAQDAIEERLFAAMEGLERVEEARSQLDELDTVSDIEELEERLLDDRTIRPRQQRKSRRSRKNDEPKGPYYSYRAKSGAEILVGRGAKHNDALSLKVARGRDIWLHARDWPGSHVILRMEKNQDAPLSEDLVDAATLAAHFSKGRNDTLVDVTYTEAKHINKPKGAPPGLVSVAGGSTLGVKIEQRRLDRLFQTRGQT